MKKLFKLFMIFAVLTLFTACSKDTKEVNKTSKENLPKVYASVYPIYDFTKKIAGDKADVEMIMPNGTEPHDWEPDQDAIKSLENADLFIYNGAGLEHWVDKVLGSLSNDLIAVEASMGVNYIEATHSHDHDHEDEEHEHHEGNNHNEAIDEHNHEKHHEHNHGNGPDPHVWLSPKNAKIEMENIKNALIEIDAENKEYYEANYEKYAKMLDDLDAKYRDNLKDLKDNKIVVSHEAYGYLCNEYGLEQLGIQGVNAETEPDAKKMAEIIDYIKENNITTIFTEELIDPKVSEIIASETGAKVEVLSPIEGLSDEQIKSNEDYFSIMEQNLENLVGALK